MLQRLTIQNFAIIDQLSLEFSAGFGVISGETGAGKSILIDAIGQLLGDRAEATMVADGSLRADITAEFTVAADHPAHQWLIDQALDGSEDDPLMIRRVLSAEGGSRSWINGRPVSAGQLRSLGAHLVQIHGQHAHHQLLRADAQRRWLDQQLDDQAKALLLDTVHAHQSLQHELSELLEHAGNRSEQELLEFQLDELKRLDPSPNDYAQLEQDQRRLAAVDTLTLAMEQALQALDLDHSGARSTTHRARAALESVLEYEPALADVMNMIAEATVNLDEAASAIQRLTESLEADPEQLGRVDERLRRYLDLARKHRVKPDQLDATQQAMDQRLHRMRNFEDRRDQLEQSLQQCQTEWQTQAKILHSARKSAAAELVSAADQALAELGMGSARIECSIEYNPDAPVSVHGADRIEILFSANPGQSPKSLKKVASGGELSRLSLAMIIASADPNQTLTRIFDEIDAGIGGETAHKVGEFLHQTGQQGQSLCVTHLAQVAARADFQLKVEKRAKTSKTLVDIVALSAEDRVAELARMLGSGQSDISRQHALALLRGEAVEV